MLVGMLVAQLLQTQPITTPLSLRASLERLAEAGEGHRRDAGHFRQPHDALPGLFGVGRHDTADLPRMHGAVGDAGQVRGLGRTARAIDGLIDPVSGTLGLLRFHEVALNVTPAYCQQESDRLRLSRIA
jgi:hypothetical protein